MSASERAAFAEAEYARRFELAFDPSVRYCRDEWDSGIDWRKNAAWIDCMRRSISEYIRVMANAPLALPVSRSAPSAGSGDSDFGYGDFGYGSMSLDPAPPAPSVAWPIMPTRQRYWLYGRPSGISVGGSAGPRRSSFTLVPLPPAPPAPGW